MTARNKFGVHIVGYGSATGYGADLKRCADAGQPFGFVKCMLTKGAAGEAKSYSKDTFTMYRASVEDRDFPHTADGSWTWANSAECKQSALDWMHACDALWQGERENFDAYELMNEPNPVTEKIPQFLEWSSYCLDEAERLGYRIGWGSFSTGCPTPEQMQRIRASRFGIQAFKAQQAAFAQQMGIMLPFVADLARRGHILCMHDGAVVEPFTFQGTATTDTEINSTLRYRWWKKLADQAGLPFPHVAITECYAYGQKSPAFYDDWQWYLTELAKDDYLIGVAWYTLGNGDSLFPNIADKPMARVVDKALDIDYSAIVENPEPTQNRIVLSIPYLNQNDPISAGDTRLDCGAACLAMLLASKGLDVTVNDVFRRTKALPGQPITFAQLQTAATSYGYTLEDRRNCTPDDLYALLRDKVAPILLVNARFLNQPGKLIPYTGAHFVVLVGSTADGFMVHDPNNTSSVIQPNLAEAWGRCSENYPDNPNNAMLILREGVTPAPAPVPTPIPIPGPDPGPAPLPATFRLGVGMGARAVPTPTEVNAIHTARLDAVKVLPLADLDENRAMMGILRQSLGDIHIMARLFFSVDSENRRKFSPAAFVEYVKGAALALHAEGVQEFEVHNEPNLIYEGWGFNWLDGISFSNWYIQVINILRGLMPEARFGFPGLSPGEPVINARQEAVSFWNEARAAIRASDFVCAHSYWQQSHGYWGMDDVTGGMSWRLCPANGRRLVISEFSNNLKSVSPAVKGTEYILYAQMLRATKLIDAAYAFALSWPGQDLNREGWVTEDGRVTEIPGIVGSRST